MMSDIPEPDLPSPHTPDIQDQTPLSDVPPMPPAEVEETDEPAEGDAPDTDDREGEPPTIPLDVPFIRPPGTQ